jgi:hypothetical protein
LLKLSDLSPPDFFQDFFGAPFLFLSRLLVTSGESCKFHFQSSPADNSSFLAGQSHPGVFLGHPNPFLFPEKSDRPCVKHLAGYS